MSYEIGTATDYQDLLVRLKDFATNPDRAIESAGMDIDELDPISEEEAWEVKRWDPDWDGSGGYELILSGPGVSGSDGILIGMQTQESLASNYFNWTLAGFTGYSDGVPFLNQMGIHYQGYDEMPVLALNDDPQKYWFVGNGRRIAGVVQVAGTYYATFYLGYLLSYATPAVFPYPLFIGGSRAWDYTAANRGYSTVADYNLGWPRGYATSTRNSALFLYTSWRGISSGGDTNCWWPYQHNYGAADIGSVAAVMRPCLDGSIPLWPLVLCTYDPDRNIFGEADGFYAALSNNLATEDEITIDGKTYIVFQNGYRTTFLDYFAMLKE